VLMLPPRMRHQACNPHARTKVNTQPPSMSCLPAHHVGSAMFSSTPVDTPSSRPGQRTRARSKSMRVRLASRGWRREMEYATAPSAPPVITAWLSAVACGDQHVGCVGRRAVSRVQRACSSEGTTCTRVSLHFALG